MSKTKSTFERYMQDPEFKKEYDLECKKLELEELKLRKELQDTINKLYASGQIDKRIRDMFYSGYFVEQDLED